MADGPCNFADSISIGFALCVVCRRENEAQLRHLKHVLEAEENLQVELMEIQRAMGEKQLEIINWASEKSECLQKIMEKRVKMCTDAIGAEATGK